MADVDVHYVIVRETTDGQWRAVSFGRNGERIAWTETYRNKADAEAAAYTISAGAEILEEEREHGRRDA